MSFTYDENGNAYWVDDYGYGDGTFSLADQGAMLANDIQEFGLSPQEAASIYGLPLEDLLTFGDPTQASDGTWTWGDLGSLGSLTQNAIGMNSNYFSYVDPSTGGTVSGTTPTSATGILDVLGKLIGGVGGSLGNLMSNPQLMATVGGLLGSGVLGGGAKEAGKITTENQPWVSQQPYLTDMFARAKQQLGSNNPMQAQANSNYSSFLEGPTNNPYLGMDNPYLNQAIQNAQDDVTRQMQGQFNTASRQSGSYGNSGLQETYARELPKQLGQISTNMRMQDYMNQQQLAESAVGRTVGATQAANSFMFDPLKQYAGLVGGQQWGGTSSSPYFTNPMAGALGGATTGAQLASMFKTT